MPRKLKNWLDGYLAYTDFSEAPQHFHFWAGISVLAGALRRKVYMDQLIYRWSPNFYIIFVAPSGVATKSTAMDAAMDLLREVEGIHFGPNSMTWQALVIELNRAEEKIPLPGGEYDSQACLTFASRELGSLIDFRDTKLVDVLVDLYDGKIGAWRKATQTYGNQIATNPWLNIAACTTPSWIAFNIPRQTIGGGFTSRCLFIYGEKKRRLIAYPKKEVSDLHSLSWFQSLRAELINDLGEIAQIAGEYELTPEAEAFGIKWYEEHWKTPPKNLIINNFDGYLARKQGHVHRVAMTVAAAYTNERRITLDDLVKAIALIDSLEPDMVKVFGHIHSDFSGQRTDEVMGIMRVYGELPRPILFQMAFGRTGIQKAEFDSIVDSACEAGALSQGANLLLRLRTLDQNYDKTDYSDELTEDLEDEGSDS